MALIRSFASSRGADLQSMGWSFWYVLGGLLGECCVIALQGAR